MWGPTSFLGGDFLKIFKVLSNYTRNQSSDLRIQFSVRIHDAISEFAFLYIKRWPPPTLGSFFKYAKYALRKAQFSCTTSHPPHFHKQKSGNIFWLLTLKMAGNLWLIHLIGFTKKKGQKNSFLGWIFWFLGGNSLIFEKGCYNFFAPWSTPRKARKGPSFMKNSGHALSSHPPLGVPCFGKSRGLGLYPTLYKGQQWGLRK